MANIKVTAPEGKRFYGRKVGEVFELPEYTARPLIRAKVLLEVSERKRRTYQRRDMVVETAPVQAEA